MLCCRGKHVCYNKLDSYVYKCNTREVEYLIKILQTCPVSLDIVSKDDSALSISDDLVHEGTGPGLQCPVTYGAE